MSTHEPIIDIDPVSSARDGAAGVAQSGFRPPSYGAQGKRGASAPESAVRATVIDGGPPPAKRPSRIGGAAQTVIGGAIMLVGVPMLILPGPGLLAIGGGAVIAANGVKKMLGR